MIGIVCASLLALSMGSYNCLERPSGSCRVETLNILEDPPRAGCTRLTPEGVILRGCGLLREDRALLSVG